MAGESARAYARRQREKSQRLIRSAERWERGAVGEAENAIHLDGLCLQGWVVFHDVRWPGRPRANIDHVAVGPGGVFVIDSKNWTGSITVRDGVLRQNSRQRESTVTRAGEAASAITGILGGIRATAVLCFVRDEPLDSWSQGVLICSTPTLVAMLTSRPPVLPPTAVPHVAAQLSSWLGSATDPVARRSQATRGPSRTHGVRASAATNERGGLRSSVGKLLVGLGLMLVGLLLVGWLIQAVASSADRTRESIFGAEAKLGETLTVDGSSARPELTAAALRVTRMEVAPNMVSVQPGDRVLAVAFRIRNKGDQGWNLSSPGTTFSITDSTGARHRPTWLRGSPRGLLSRNAAVAPGDDERGRILFELPKSVKVTDVTMSVGPGIPRTLRWHLAD